MPKPPPKVSVTEAALMCDDDSTPAAGQPRPMPKTVVMPPEPERPPPRGMTACPPEGIYPNMPFPEYVAIDAWNNSCLRLMGVPRMAKIARDHPIDSETESKAKGIALHMAVLEPDRFGECVIGPPLHEWTVKATGERKCEPYGRDTKAWADYALANPGKLILTPEDLADIAVQKAELWRLKESRLLLEAPGLTEVTMIWRDQETGVMMKGRVDKAIPSFGWIDLKTTESAAPNDFRHSFVKYGYAVQVPLYARGVRRLRELGIIDWPERMAVVAVDTPNDHKVSGAVVYAPEDDTLVCGNILLKGWLKTLKMCLLTRCWPSYTATDEEYETIKAAGYDWPTGVQTIGAPAFWKAKFNDAEI